MGRSRNQERDRNSDPAAVQRSTDLFEVRVPGTGLRSVTGASIRVCAVIANRGLLRVGHATCRLSDMRRDSGASSLVRRQEPVDHDVPLVFGGLSQAALVAGRGRGVRHDVAECVSLGQTGCFVGFGSSQPERHRVDRCRRSAVATGAQVPDAGPCSDRKRADRRWLEATVMDRPGPHDEDLAAVLPPAGQETFRKSEVRVQRHVEAVLESDCQEGGWGHPGAGPVSHHAEDEQGDRRGAGCGSETFTGGRLRAGVETLAVVPMETPRELDIQGDGETLGTASRQFAVRSGSLAAGRLESASGST